MYQLSRILQHVVNGLYNASPAQHDLVPHGYEFILHVGSDTCHQMNAILEEHVEEPWRDVSPVGEEFPVERLGHDCPDLRIPVVHVGTREAERDDLSPVVADEVQLEAVTPAHRTLAVCGQPPEHLVGIAAEIVAHWHHRGVHEADTRAAAEGGEIQEEHHREEDTALKLNEAVVGNRIWKIRPEMLPDEEQVVVLEIAERAELEYDEDGHNLTVRKRGLAVAAMPAIGGHQGLFVYFLVKFFAEFIHGTENFCNFVLGNHKVYFVPIYK